MKWLLTLLQGHAWAVYDELGENQTDTHDYLKAAHLRQLSPETDEDRLSAREELSRRQLHEEQESVNKLACDINQVIDLTFQWKFEILSYVSISLVLFQRRTHCNSSCCPS